MITNTSVIMVTWNRALQLKRGLNSLLRQSVLPSEFVIVDDGSQDEGKTKEAVRLFTQKCDDLKIEVKYIYLNYPQPRISCYPRNVGIKQASYDVLLFTEPECLHLSFSVHNMVKAMQDNPNNTILASQAWTMGQAIFNNLSEDYFEEPEKLLSHKYAMIAIDSNLGNTNAPDSDWAITGEMNCNAGLYFGTRKQWLLKIGGFNEDFTGHGFDDFDLFNRLAIYGKGLKKVDNIPVIHQYHDKNYPYNIYDHANRNGKISEEMINKGLYKVNEGRNWGEI